MSRNKRSITGPITKTAVSANTSRMAAIRESNSMNVNASAAGFNTGDASNSPSAGPNLPDVSATLVKTGATQHEHSIRGAPANPAVSCAVTGFLIAKPANQPGETKVRTAAPINTPKASAGQITAK